MIKETYYTCLSSDRQLELACFMTAPMGQAKGIVQMLHGMAEHKERYIPWMRYLSLRGYVCVIHDHRGHGKSVKSSDDWGYFYDDSAQEIVNDVECIAKDIEHKYPHLPRILFAHSMGTLVARCYLQKNDAKLAALVLSGAPCFNSLSGVAIAMAKCISLVGGPYRRSKLLYNMALKPYNKKFKTDGENAWLSQNQENVQAYNADKRCGFYFTTNGYLNLFKLLHRTYSINLYQTTNPHLPILMVAGEEDPVIGGIEKYLQQKKCLNQVGYTHIEQICYTGLRHEILQEKQAEQIMKDIFCFLDTNVGSTT